MPRKSSSQAKAALLLLQLLSAHAQMNYGAGGGGGYFSQPSNYGGQAYNAQPQGYGGGQGAYQNGGYAPAPPRGANYGSPGGLQPARNPFDTSRSSAQPEASRPTSGDGGHGAPASPVVGSLDPQNGPTAGGTIVTVGGMNFGNGNSKVQPTVTVGGQPCQQVVWVSSTSVLCETPDGVGAHKPVIVEVKGVSSTANGDSEFDYDAPSVIAIEPGHGSAAGGTMVTVVGKNFGASNNNPSVTIGGRPCQSVVWLSDSKLQCVSPPGIGIGDVRVFVLDQSSPENFGTIFEFDAPEISKIVPDHGPSTGGYTITLEGLNFGTVNSHPDIKIGSESCSATSWKSNTAIMCVVPKGMGVDKSVVVNILGQPSKSNLKAVFSYDGPRITALEPANGPTIGGTHITMLGLNFGQEADKNINARIGNIPCSSVTWVSQSAATCITPPGVGFDREVDLVVGGLHSGACTAGEKAAGSLGAGAGCGNLFKYDAPTISHILPNHGPTSGGYFIQVPGDNYGTTPTSLKLFVGKEPCEKTNWVSNTMAQCLVPAGVGITHVVVNVEGQESSVKTLSSAEADVFTYDAPVVDRILPSTGSPEGGQLVTVEGRNFGTDKSEVQVLVSGSPGRVVHVSQERILMVMPSGEGDRQVLVRVGDQQSGGQPSNQAVPQYDYQGPKITSVFPVHGATQGGQQITIYGKDMGSAGTRLHVDVGGIECIDSRWVSVDEVYCTTPPGSGGNKEVKVVVDGQFTATSPANFKFSYSAPVVQAVTPATGNSDGGTRILIQGLNFGLTDTHPVAYVGPTRCQATVWTDDAALTCITPGWSEGPVVEPVTVRLEGQTSRESASAVFQFGNQKSPVITSLAWTRAPTDGGGTLTLFGSKFEDRHVVAEVGKFGGGYKKCRQTVWVSESKVKCVVPSGVGKGLPISLSSKDFPIATTFGSVAFEYDPPVVTAMSSSTGAIGGGMAVTLTGYGFGISDTHPEGMIGGSVCKSSQWKSDSSLVCVTPAGQGLGDVVAVNVGDQISLTGQYSPKFNYQGRAITAISPAYGPTSGGVEVTLYSSDFGDLKNQPRVEAYIGKSTYGSQCAQAEWISASAVKCRMPAGAGGSLDSTVVIEGMGAVSQEVYEGFGLFSYMEPAVFSITPDFGNSAGGLPVTISGSSFGVSDENPVAYVGPTACSRTLYMSNTKLVCVTPPGGGSAMGVSVKIGGQSSNPLNAFSYEAPKVSYVEPPSGPITGNSLITIVGKNFGKSAVAKPQASVGGVLCLKTTWVSDSEVECTTPRGKDLYSRHHVLVDVQGVQSSQAPDALYTFIEGQGGSESGLTVPAPSGPKPAGERAPGVYLTIAYLVALAFIIGGIACVRLLFSRGGGGTRAPKSKRGIIARIINRIWGTFFKSQGDSAADASMYHIVDQIDIEMESSEIDMVEQRELR